MSYYSSTSMSAAPKHQTQTLIQTHTGNSSPISQKQHGKTGRYGPNEANLIELLVFRAHVSLSPDEIGHQNNNNESKQGSSDNYGNKEALRISLAIHS